MSPALPLALVASDCWKSAAFDVVAFAYRVAQAVRKAHGSQAVGRRLWLLDKHLRDLQEAFYKPAAEPSGAEAPTHEQLSGAVQAVRALLASFLSLELTLRAGGFLNNGKIAAPTTSIIERAEDLAEFADAVEAIINPEKRAEANAIYDRVLSEFHKGDTVELDTII